ncbi:LysE family translocator [Leeia sp.]|uniref:LysE family translocator n=1 Tax=Leeia sp. TaxID=2884678 RepID=UPI0035B29D34
MSEAAYWLLFFSAALALVVSPGPDLLYILSRSIAGGTRIGLAATAGVCSGALVHVTAAALGLSAILATSVTAFNVVKYVGAAYLIYLGIKALRSAGAAFRVDDQPRQHTTPWQAFRQGVLIDVLNPKVAVFYMAFLPQFVRHGHGTTAQQLMLLGVLVILVAIVVEAAFVLATARTTRFFRNHPRASVWLDRVFGGVLLALGVRLALSQQR